MTLGTRWVVALCIGLLGAALAWLELHQAVTADAVRAAVALGSGAGLVALTMLVLPRKTPFDPTHGEQQRVVESGH